MKAAEIINMRHGWEQPQEIRNMRKVELAEDCEHTLKDMQQFNIDRYFNLLRMKGYEVKPRYDKQRKLVGYTVGKNASVFKASEIGRKYMVSKIEDTWMKLHPKPTQVKTKPVSPSVASTPRQFVLSFRLQQHHNQRRNLKLHKRHSQSTLAMKSKRCGFRTLSKMSLLMRFRFQRIMILRQQRMSLM